MKKEKLLKRGRRRRKKGTDISGITKNILQTKSAVKLNVSAKKREKEIDISFRYGEWTSFI